MTVLELRVALARLPEDLEVVLEAGCFDDPHHVAVASAARVVAEDRGDGRKAYVTSEDA